MKERMPALLKRTRTIKKSINRIKPKMFIQARNIKIAVAVVLVLILTVNTVMNICILSRLNKNVSYSEGLPHSPSAENETAAGSPIDDEFDEETYGFDESQDGFVIADEYTIMPTKAISDAYRTGDASMLSETGIETLDMAKQVLEGTVTSGMTDYEKEKAVFDWMVKNVDYDSGALLVVAASSGYASPHDVLKQRCAVCVGFAVTFRMFMEMLDIQCVVVHNKDLGHSWNVVKIDGDWYVCDLYYQKKKGLPYEYFNMNDTLCAADHDWNRRDFPSAVGYEKSERYINCHTIRSVDELPAFMREKIGGGDIYLPLRIKNFDYTDEKDRAAGVYTMQSITNYLHSTIEYENCVVSWSWSPCGRDYLLVIKYYAEDPDAEESYELDNEAIGRIDENVAGSFANLTPYYG